MTVGRAGTARPLGPELAAPAARPGGGRASGALGARVQVAVAALLLVACVVPFWAGRFLPLLDLPEHLGLATVIRHLGDPAWGFGRYYHVTFAPLPYWGFYLPTALLGFLLPIPVAAKVVLSAYALGVPLGAADVLGAFGRDRRLAVFAVPMVFSADLFMGFASFLVSVPLWLFALAAMERWLARPAGEGARRRALAAAGLAVAVYLAHGQSVLLLLCALGVLFVAHGARWRALWPFAPVTGLVAYWIATVEARPPSAIASPLHLAMYRRFHMIGRVAWNTLGQSLDHFGRYVFDAFPGLLPDVLWLALLGVFAVLLAFQPPRPAPEADAPAAGLARWAHRWRLELLSLGLLASYFACPMTLGLQWYVSPRHLVFALLLAPALLGARPLSGWRRWLLVPAVALALAVPAFVATRVHAFDAEMAGLEPLLAAARPRGRTLGLPFDNGWGHPTTSWPLLHAEAYFQVHGGGDLGYSFAGLPSIPVRYRPGAQAPHPYQWRPREFSWKRFGRYYDRILVHGRATGDAAHLARHAARVLRSGAWTLYVLDRPAPEAGAPGATP